MTLNLSHSIIKESASDLYAQKCGLQWNLRIMDTLGPLSFVKRFNLSSFEVSFIEGSTIHERAN